MLTSLSQSNVYIRCIIIAKNTGPCHHHVSDIIFVIYNMYYMLYITIIHSRKYIRYLDVSLMASYK